MHYKSYFERVNLVGDNEVVVEAVYEQDGVTREFEGTADTVTSAHALLREFRAEFRKALKGPAPETEQESRESWEAVESPYGNVR